MAKGKQEIAFEVQAIEMNRIEFFLCGTSPMIMNRFSQKARQELLFPAARRSRADLDQTLKHDPLAEFRGGVYRNRDSNTPTLIHVPNGAFHGALAQAAIDVPGAAKAKIERLTKIVDVTVGLYGVPQMFMAMVRSSDMNHTPDVRTRPIFPEWACSISVSYVKKILTERTIGNLLGAAGIIVGIGDWRAQKGGPYGSFRLCAQNDPEYNKIVKTQGRAAQLKALESPVCFDEDTQELFDWFQQTLSLREKGDLVAGAKPRTKRGAVVENGNGELVQELNA